MFKSPFTAGAFGEVPEEYKHHPRTRASALMDYAESPAHFESFQILNEREETRPMALGTAIHAAVLEPDKFRATYIDDPVPLPNELVTQAQLRVELEKRGLKVSGSKSEQITRLIADGYPSVLIYDCVRADHVGEKQVLSAKEWRAAQRIVGRIERNPRLKWLLSEGYPEHAGWVLHGDTGIVVTFTTDYHRSFPARFMGYDGAVIDVKKFRAVDRKAFEAQVFNSGVYIQAAFYRDAVSYVMGVKHLFAWVAVDDKPPFTVMGYKAQEAVLDAGQQAYGKALLGLADSFANDHWPCYSEQLEECGFPHWAWSELEYSEGDYEQA